MINAILILQSARLEVEQERKQHELFMDSIKHLPVERRSELIKEREEMKEKIRQEMKEERRHRELCSAIRMSRPRGIGIFW